MADPTDPRGWLALVREARKLAAEAGEGAGALACARCGHLAVLDGDYCTACGHRVRLPCPRCEAPCTAGMGFCPSCGVELSDGVVEDAVAALQDEADRQRARREADILRSFERQRVVQEGRVRHLVGTRADGSLAFLKVATSTAGRRLLRNEIERIRALGEHAGVPRLLAVQDEDDRVVAVLEHVPNRPIRFPIAIGRLLTIVSAALDTLAHAHERGVVHADLKPAHLLLRDDDRPVLIDWNIAQAPGPSLFSAFTPLFAAPEQIVGDHVDARVDLYAMGVVLYLLFTHDRFPAVLEERSEPEPMLEVLQARKAMNRAFLSEGTVYKGKLARLQQQAAPMPAEGLEERRVLGAKYLFSSELQRTTDVNADIRLTGELLAIVQTATAVDPDDRYPSAASMKDAVDAVRAQVTGGDHADP